MAFSTSFESVFLSSENYILLLCQQSHGEQFFFIKGMTCVYNKECILMRFLKRIDQFQTAWAFSLHSLPDKAWLDVTVTPDANIQTDNAS